MSLDLRVSEGREAIKSFTQGSDVIRTAYGGLLWFNFITLETMVFYFETIICRSWLIPACKSQLVDPEEFCKPFVKHSCYLKLGYIRLKLKILKIKVILKTHHFQIILLLIFYYHLCSWDCLLYLYYRNTSANDILCFSSQFCNQWYNVGSLKSATVQLFTLWKWASTTNQGSTSAPPHTPHLWRVGC